MNPIYKFQLSAGNDTRQAFPVYKDDLAIDYALEQNEEFYRGKLSGKLTFQKDDYLFIRNKAFDTQFDVIISISYDGGQTWTVYWSGQFWKTDCKFNEDDQTAIVTPNVNDRYNAVLAGMEKEYNLIDLAPVIQPVKLDKRPMIQVYVPGQTVIGCFLSGMWWEQECDAVDNESELESTYYFALNKKQRILDITQTGTPELPDFAMGTPGYQSYYVITARGFSFSARYDETTEPENPFNVWEITRISDGVVLFRYKSYAVEPNMPYSVTLNAVEGSGATGSVTIYVHDMAVYARYVTDVEQNTYQIPANDIVENNRNYSRVVPYNNPSTILFSDAIVNFPTKWGIYQPGQYYFNPADSPSARIGEAFPVARSAWGRVSVWFTFSLFDWIVEREWRKEYTLKDAFPIWSVISVLLAKIAPGITHDGTTDYSKFLYDTNPIANIDQLLFITPKSNLIASGYDQPAQKAPITLKRVTDMLRDCFRCYWFIDNQNRFRIEHISYFMNGGAYPGTPNFPVVGIDLTQQIVTRNGKPWSYARNQYEFDKPEMAARYQFGWMDDVTQLFDGYPIDIISKYVNPDNIEQIDVSQFTSDVDYILLNPGEISKDGFVLLGVQKDSTTPTVSQGSTAWLFDYSLTAGVAYDVMLVGGTMETRVLAVGSQILGTMRRNEWVRLTPQESGTPYIYFGSGDPGEQPTVRFSIVRNDRLPYVNFVYNGTNHILQNAWVSFMFLQRYYMFDMPARNVEINGVQQYVYGIKKLKTQTIKFPVLTEPDLTNLIKTELGNGTIQKMSVNLSSRNANTTLKYDTE